MQNCLTFVEAFNICHLKSVSGFSVDKHDLWRNMKTNLIIIMLRKVMKVGM